MINGCEAHFFSPGGFCFVNLIIKSLSFSRKTPERERERKEEALEIFQSSTKRNSLDNLTSSVNFFPNFSLNTEKFSQVEEAIIN